MGRKFCITEEQYNMALREGVAIEKTKVQAKSPDSSSIKQAKDNAIANGLPKDNMEVVAPIKNNQTQLSNMSNTDKQNAEVVIQSEGRYIKKSQLKENRLKTLKQNSELYTVKDFINKIKK